MYSRAHLLIELQIEKLLVDPPWGIEIRSVYDDTVFEWVAKVKGLTNTPWEGGIFQVYIRFDEHFNIRPPQIVFHTIPFHPNVDVNTGRPCVDFLDDYQIWNEDYSLAMILVSLQTLLSNPVCESAVNTDAAKILLTSPEMYQQIIRECILNSQMVEAGKSLTAVSPPKMKFNIVTTVKQHLTAPSRTGFSQVKRLSFEEYHKTWRGIATSKTAPTVINPFLESIKDQHPLQKIHECLSREELEELKRKQLEVDNILVYGHFNNKKLPKTEKAAKLAKLDRMKQIYLPPRQSPATPMHDMDIDKVLLSELHEKGEQDEWEEQVDDLVRWSYNLDSNILDPR